jgi:hypothetical protein
MKTSAWRGTIAKALETRGQCSNPAMYLGRLKCFGEFKAVLLCKIDLTCNVCCEMLSFFKRGVVYVHSVLVRLPPRSGAMGREIESRQGLGR